MTTFGGIVMMLFSALFAFYLLGAGFISLFMNAILWKIRGDHWARRKAYAYSTLFILGGFAVTYGIWYFNPFQGVH